MPPYDLGFAAFTKGAQRSMNPFPVGSPEFYAWNDGYDRAEELADFEDDE